MVCSDDITPPIAQGNANNGVYNTGVEDIRSPPSRDCRKCQTYLSKFSLEFDTLYFCRSSIVFISLTIISL